MTAELATFIEKQVIWFGQSAFRITSSLSEVLYIDPFKISGSPVPADCVLITHPHHDHYNPKVISQIRKSDTAVIVPESMKSEGMKGIRCGEKIKIKSFTIEAVPAYNCRKFPHAPKNGWLGYIIEVDNIRVLHAGDSDFIPPMSTFEVNIAMLPVVGFVSMNIDSAVKAAHAMKTSMVIPMHYGLMPGTKKNGQKFARVFDGTTIIMKPYTEKS
jgi:L-ascorbate metabolism protein UlaG (beta-lactamase superfamily)